ncbi:site-specific integrase [Devosia sp. SL43]|nr:site-specific integrase [Devosia sp. SL43]
MPSPTKHPSTGVYWLRQRVPSKILPIAKGQVVEVTIAGVNSRLKLGDFIKVSLGTKSPIEARIRATEALGQFQAVWAMLQAAPKDLTLKEIVALAGEAFRAFQRLEDDPGDPEIWSRVIEENFRAFNGETPYPFIGTEEQRYLQAMESRFGGFVDATLMHQKVRVTDSTRRKLLEQFERALRDAAELLLKRSTGNFSSDTRGDKYPSIGVAKQTSRGSSKLSLFALIDHKQKTQSQRADTFDKYRRCLRDFVKFTGHDDAKKITKTDVRGWRDALIERGLARKTINDQYLTSLKVALNHGVKEFDLAVSVAGGIRDERDAPSSNRPKGYTIDEARTILQATFQGTSKDIAVPYQRAIFWVPWICAYTGMRVSEVTQFQGRSLRVEGDVTYMLVTPEDGSTKGKNAWTVGIHKHLVELGLVEMFREIGDGPAFYTPYPEGTDLRAQTNHRSKDSADRVAAWITEEVGIIAPQNRPNHAFRHTFTSLTRICKMDKEARDYMMGSRSQTDAREGYGDWAPSVVDAEINKLPRFDVEDTGWRPTMEKVRPLAVGAASNSVSMKR